MLRIVPHNKSRVGRSYELVPGGFELHLLQHARRGTTATAHSIRQDLFLSVSISAFEFRLLGFGIRDSGFGIRVSGFGQGRNSWFEYLNIWFLVSCFVFRSFLFRVSCLAVRVARSVLRASGFRVSGVAVSGSEFGVRASG